MNCDILVFERFNKPVSDDQFASIKVAVSNEACWITDCVNEFSAALINSVSLSGQCMPWIYCERASGVLPARRQSNCLRVYKESVAGSRGAKADENEDRIVKVACKKSVWHLR